MMDARIGTLVLSICLAVAAGADDNAEIADPFEVIAAFDRFAEMDLWPGFEATEYPLAVYDGEQTLLMRHPDPPEGFEKLDGHEGVWSSPGRHPAMRWNSNADIGGVRTATLLLTIEPGRTVKFEASILFHEVFHLFSKPLHPTWRPNEVFRYSYPMSNIDNYRMLLLEEEALARAVESETEAGAASWAAEALAIRLERMSKLDNDHSTFETALELQEGTAVYMGRSALGTAKETTRLREERGPAGIRWRCYETGASISVILDRLLPEWKVMLDENPEITFAQLLEAALTTREVSPATFSEEDISTISNRAEAAIADLVDARRAHYDDFAGRGKRVVIRLADNADLLEMTRFDPMAVEILDDGEALQAHNLTAVHPRGEISLVNPSFVRRTLDGVLALTTPAGEHPFLEGFRQVAISGFADEPKVTRDGDAVTLEAEGLTVQFDAAEVESSNERIVITVFSAADPR